LIFISFSQVWSLLLSSHLLQDGRYGRFLPAGFLAQKHMKEIYKMRKANDEDGLYDLQEKLFSRSTGDSCQATGISFHSGAD